MPKNRYSITVKEIIYFVIYTKLLKLKNINTKKTYCWNRRVFQVRTTLEAFFKDYVAEDAYFRPCYRQINVCEK